MKSLYVCLILATVSLTTVSAADFTGVWKLKSGGGGLKDVTMVIERNGMEVHQKSVGMRGTMEQRSEFTYKIGGTTTNDFRGEPMKSEVRQEADILEIVSSAETPRGAFMSQEIWKISSDGNTLVVQQHTEIAKRANDSSAVYERAPASAAEVLNRPEQKAVDGFKNIQLLKEVPVSQFIPIMRSFNTALGVQCEHCHVPDNYSADEKTPKATARKMIQMAGGINRDNFGGQHAVTCYTCHRGQTKPATAAASPAR